MPDTESDHHRGVAAVARLDLVATPAAPATTSSSCATATVRDEDKEDGFTFAAAVDVAIPRLQDGDDDCAFPDARIGSPVYPVFGRSRRSLSLPKQKQEQDEIEEEEEDSAAAGTATVRGGGGGLRVPLGRLLLEEEEEEWLDCAPSAAGQQRQPVDVAEAELDGAPAETYCLWSPACYQNSGSTRSSVLFRWRRRRIVVEPSHSDGRSDEFVFVGTSSDRIGAGGEQQGWMNRGTAARGGGKSTMTSTSFFPCKQNLVELVVSAVTCRRSCNLF